MAVLGITGRDRDAAAALAVDGKVVAAATEDSFARVPGIGYALTGGFPIGAARACLDAVGLAADEVTEVVIVDEGTEGAGVALAPSVTSSAKPIRVLVVDATVADSRLSPASTTIVLGSTPPALSVLHRSDRGELVRVDVAGAAEVFTAIATMARTLGLHGNDPLAALERLSVGGDAEFVNEVGAALSWDEGGDRILADEAALAGAAQRVAGERATELASPGSLNARVQQMRRSLAASFTSSLASIVSRVAQRSANGSGSVGFAGAAFGNARFNTELARHLDREPMFAAVPEPVGRALAAAAGAAFDGAVPLALGPAFSEEDIKRTLDNCRLDYVYEPDWPRLVARVSAMLAQGKVVAWFQGPMAFGPRALGTRSILADPSSRYARQNVNEYLRGLPIDEPLPIAFAPGLAQQCVDLPATGGVRDAVVRSDWRQPLHAALDWRGGVRLHDGSPAPASRLSDLLEAHHAATGVPGLIEVPLAGPGEPIACTPRDAIRGVYSSAIDALVIGRFLLMKDYWLLRAAQ